MGVRFEPPSRATVTRPAAHTPRTKRRTVVQALAAPYPLSLKYSSSRPALYERYSVPLLWLLLVNWLRVTASSIASYQK